MPPPELPQDCVGHLGSPLSKALRMASSAAGTGDTGAVTVFVTVPSEKVGEDIAGLLVNPEARLAACVNIIPGEQIISMHVCLHVTARRDAGGAQCWQEYHRHMFP